jgi:hypothetical protein
MSKYEVFSVPMDYSKLQSADTIPFVESLNLRVEGEQGNYKLMANTDKGRKQVQVMSYMGGATVVVYEEQTPDGLKRYEAPAPILHMILPSRYDSSHADARRPYDTHIDDHTGLTERVIEAIVENAPTFQDQNAEEI